jgi:NAD+ diphosphatase
MLRTPENFEAFTAAPEGAANIVTLIFRGSDVLTLENGAIPAAQICAFFEENSSAPEWVGKLADTHYAVRFVAKEVEAPAGHTFRGMRTLWGVWRDEEVAVAGRAFQLQNWARTHRYCGVCGTATQRIQGERGIKCPSCGFSAYPRISPAMMVLITRSEEILLARNVTFPPNRYSALAGFLEVGESIEEAVHREVFEEVGLKVHNLKYVASQAWPFPHSLMIAFTAEYLSGEIVTQPEEIADAKWYGPGDHLPDLPPRLSIAKVLLESVMARWPGR